MSMDGTGVRRFVTSGIWRPVRLEAWDKVRIADFAIRQRDVSREVAHSMPRSRSKPRRMVLANLRCTTSTRAKPASS